MGERERSKHSGLPHPYYYIGVLQYYVQYTSTSESTLFLLLLLSEMCDLLVCHLFGLVEGGGGGKADVFEVDLAPSALLRLPPTPTPTSSLRPRSSFLLLLLHLSLSLSLSLSLCLPSSIYLVVRLERPKVRLGAGGALD